MPCPLPCRPGYLPPDRRRRSGDSDQRLQNSKHSPFSVHPSRGPHSSNTRRPACHPPTSWVYCQGRVCAVDASRRGHGPPVRGRRPQPHPHDLGRWRSDELFRYLHVQAHPNMTGIAAAMLRGGSYQRVPSRSFVSPTLFHCLWPTRGSNRATPWGASTVSG